MHIKVILPKNIPLDLHRGRVVAIIHECFDFLELQSESDGKPPHVHLSLETSLEPPDTHLIMVATMRNEDNHREMSQAALTAAKAVSEYFGLKLEGHLVRSEKL